MASEYVPKLGDTLLIEVDITDIKPDGNYVCSPTHQTTYTYPMSADIYVDKETARLGKRQLRPNDLVRYSANPEGDEEGRAHYFRGRLVAWDNHRNVWIIRDNTSSTTGGSLVERKPEHVWHD